MKDNIINISIDKETVKEYYEHFMTCRNDIESKENIQNSETQVLEQNISNSKTEIKNDEPKPETQLLEQNNAICQTENTIEPKKVKSLITETREPILDDFEIQPRRVSLFEKINMYIPRSKYIKYSVGAIFLSLTGYYLFEKLK